MEVELERASTLWRGERDGVHSAAEFTGLTLDHARALAAAAGWTLVRRGGDDLITDDLITDNLRGDRIAVWLDDAGLVERAEIG